MRPKLTDIRIDDLVVNLGRQPRILIVDDEEAITNVLGIAFSIVGYDVATLQCTNSAGDHIMGVTGHYDAVVSDYNNKGASGDYKGGMTLYQRLQENAALPPLYVVISGQESLLIPQEVPFMLKPVDLYGLAHRVTSELRGRLGPAAGYASQAPEAK